MSGTTGKSEIKSAEEIKEIVLAEYAKGNVVAYTTKDGIQAMPLKEFVKQPAEGILYDLNRSEAVVLTFIHDPKWVNDYAVAKVIQELKQQLSQFTSKVELKKPLSNISDEDAIEAAKILKPHDEYLHTVIDGKMYIKHLFDGTMQTWDKYSKLYQYLQSNNYELLKYF